MKISRRRFLGLSGAAAVGAAAAVIQQRSRDTTLELTLEERTIEIPDLPRSFEGYRIGYLSDIHLGAFVPNEMVLDAVARVNDVKVDLVLLGGDYLWVADPPFVALGITLNSAFQRYSKHEMPARIYAAVFDILRGCRAPDGTHAVLGNHDRWVDPRSCKASMAEHGIPLLINQRFEVRRGEESLSLIGVDDCWSGIPTLPPLGPKVAGREVRVLLAHNPDYFAELFRSGSHGIDLALAGHTHGGQVVLPFIGAPTYNIRNLEYRSGLYRHPSGVACYTTRGVGVVELPMRVNCPPEVTVISLRRV